MAGDRKNELEETLTPNSHLEQLLQQLKNMDINKTSYPLENAPTSAGVHEMFFGNIDTGNDTRHKPQVNIIRKPDMVLIRN